MTTRAQLEIVLDGFEAIKREVMRKDPLLYEQWKAGGYLVSSNVVSMYPNIEEVVEKLETLEEEDNEDEE